MISTFEIIEKRSSKLEFSDNQRLWSTSPAWLTALSAKATSHCWTTAEKALLETALIKEQVSWAHWHSAPDLRVSNSGKPRWRNRACIAHCSALLFHHYFHYSWVVQSIFKQDYLWKTATIWVCSVYKNFQHKVWIGGSSVDDLTHGCLLGSPNF